MSSLFFPTVSTHVVIEAPPSVVRSVFFDFPQYPEWNPFITSLKTTPAAAPGDNVDFVALGKAITSTVYENTLERFSWTGIVGFEWLFKGHHKYEFEPYGDLRPDGETMGCKFVNREEFSGILCLFFFLIRGNAEKGFVAMNTALKERAEAVAKEQGSG